MHRKVNTKSETKFQSQISANRLSGTGPSGLDRTHEVALRALCQCSFCMIRSLTGVSWFQALSFFLSRKLYI